MKKVKKYFLLLTVICFTVTGTAFAESSDLNRINVNATAVMEVAPDIAYIDFSVKGYGDNAQQATSDAALKIEKVRKTLLGMGMTSDEVVTTSYSLDKKYDTKGNAKGYISTNSVQITLNDIKKVGNVIDKISTAGIDSIQGISYSVKNKDLYQNQLLTQAVANARKQAEVVAVAGNRTLGNLLCASINNFKHYNLMAKEAYSSSADTNIAVNKITLRVSVDTSFVLK